MQLYFFSLDYLVAIVQKLHKDGVITKSVFSNSTHAYHIIIRAVESGLIKKCTCLQTKRQHYRGRGRIPLFYQLNRDYTTIRIKDLVPLLTKISRLEARVYQLIPDMHVGTLVQLRLPLLKPYVTTYGRDKLLSILSCLSHCDYTQCDDMFRVVSHSGQRRMILSDLVKTGVVDVVRGKGYMLKRPLAKMKIQQLLPLLLSTSKRKQTYNQAIYFLRHRPVSCLVYADNE